MPRRDLAGYLNAAPDSVKIPRIGKPLQFRAVVRIGPEEQKLSEVLANIANHDSVKDDSILRPGTYDILCNLRVTRTSR